MSKPIDIPRRKSLPSIKPIIVNPDINIPRICAWCAKDKIKIADNYICADSECETWKMPPELQPPKLIRQNGIYHEFKFLYSKIQPLEKDVDSGSS